MAWQKSKFRRTPKPDMRILAAKQQRIFMAQPAHRPLDIHAKDLIRKEYVRQSPWWFTMRRKGIRRAKIGDDPLELRAVPRGMVRGTLPERIVYFFLINRLHMVADVDFTFQSSQSGGRIELGGLVADFLFPIMKIVIQVQGPTHGGFLRAKKDQEQMDVLADLGYRTFEITDTHIYDEQRFEDWMRRVFNLGGIGAITGGTVRADIPYSPPIVSQTPHSQPVSEQELLDEAVMDLILTTLEDTISMTQDNIWQT